MNVRKRPYSGRFLTFMKIVTRSGVSPQPTWRNDHRLLACAFADQVGASRLPVVSAMPANQPGQGVSNRLNNPEYHATLIHSSKESDLTPLGRDDSLRVDGTTGRREAPTGPTAATQGSSVRGLLPGERSPPEEPPEARPFTSPLTSTVALDVDCRPRRRPALDLY